ncbi:uncharacterized protein DUF4188 [Algoriphagus boseongensis]|uniref:Uncharacterized protein DUF4188 n=1 Tax=Algoriphagus boseongensis TaxID=1442587 RepID=A0A4R6T7I1_9BACT|nr:DUF4188 domain-containing protein [Algoriphagus boseongensis]TDQ16630.1 uncharacterized protein DUF4188 [Algoriphagus boseongensis]
MARTINQRMTAKIEGDFVVFIIGMRINRFWKFHKWLPVAMAMPKMLEELSKKPESGFLGVQSAGGLSPVMVQYWRSFEHLEAYAKDRDGLHYPAWREFNKKIKSNGDVGIWHETYKVKAGDYECIYNNMPIYGLGKIGELIPVSGKRETAAERISAQV